MKLCSYNFVVHTLVATNMSVNVHFLTIKKVFIFFQPTDASAVMPLAHYLTRRNSTHIRQTVSVAHAENVFHANSMFLWSKKEDDVAQLEFHKDAQ